MTNQPASVAAEIDRLIELYRDLSRGLIAVTQTERPEGSELDDELVSTLSDAELALLRVGEHLLDAQALAAALD